MLPVTIIKTIIIIIIMYLFLNSHIFSVNILLLHFFASWSLSYTLINTNQINIFYFHYSTCIVSIHVGLGDALVF